MYLVLSFSLPPPPLRFLDLSLFLPFLVLSVCNSAYLFLFCHHDGSQARPCVLVFCLKGPRALSSCISSALSSCISTVHTHTHNDTFLLSHRTSSSSWVTSSWSRSSSSAQEKFWHGDQPFLTSCPFSIPVILVSSAFHWNFERIALQIPSLLKNKYMKFITQKDRKHTVLLAANVTSSKKSEKVLTSRQILPEPLHPKYAKVHTKYQLQGQHSDAKNTGLSPAGFFLLCFKNKIQEILPSLTTLPNEATQPLDSPRQRSHQGKSPWLSTG